MDTGNILGSLSLFGSKKEEVNLEAVFKEKS